MAPFFVTHDLFLTPTSVRTAPLHGTHDADMQGLTPRQWSDIIHAEAVFLHADGSEMGKRRLSATPQTRLLAEIPTGARGLRVRVVSNGETTAAEFAF